MLPENTSAAYILSSRHSGGISVFSKSLHLELSRLGLRVYVIDSLPKFLLSRFLLHRDSCHITYGLFNFFNLFFSASIRVFHGLPSLRQQGVIKSILYSQVIFFSRFARGVNLSISSFVHSLLLDYHCLQTYMLLNSIPSDLLHLQSFFGFSSPRLSQWKSRKFKFCFLGRPTKFKLDLSWAESILEFYESSSFSVLGHNPYCFSRLSRLYGLDRAVCMGPISRDRVACSF